MNRYDRLYETTEHAKVRFIGFVTDHSRYDFGMVFTNQFFGKPLVICMQTGKSVLMCAEDAENTEYLMEAFRIKEIEDAQQLSVFFQYHLPTTQTAEFES